MRSLFSRAGEQGNLGTLIAPTKRQQGEQKTPSPAVRLCFCICVILTCFLPE